MVGVGWEAMALVEAKLPHCSRVSLVMCHDLLTTVRALCYWTPALAETVRLSRVACRLVCVLKCSYSREQSVPHAGHIVATKYLGGLSIFLKPDKLRPHCLHFRVVGKHALSAKRQLARVLNDLPRLPIDNEGNSAIDFDNVTNSTEPYVLVEVPTRAEVTRNCQLLLNVYRTFTNENLLAPCFVFLHRLWQLRVLGEPEREVLMNLIAPEERVALRFFDLFRNINLEVSPWTCLEIF